MVRKGLDDGLLSFAALVKSEMGTPPTSLAEEAAAAAGMTAAANEVTARTEAAVAESSKAAALHAKTQALAALTQQKASLTEAHRLFALKFVARRSAQSMHESSDAITAKVVMVQEAREYTILGESEYDKSDPDNLPSVSVVLQERKDAKAALQILVFTYEAGLEATGTLDDDTGKFVRARSLPLLYPTHATEKAEEGKSSTDVRDNISDGNTTTMTTTTNKETTAALLDSTAPLLPALPPPLDSARERDQGRVRGRRRRRNVVNTNASKQDEHKNEGGTSSSVRRSSRHSARGSLTAATGKSTEEEGDREVESELDGSAGSN